MIPKLILHAGTHKTGTTSLQVYLDTHRDVLARRGILYPATGVSSYPAPKHQWMVPALLAPDGAGFARKMGDVLADTGSGMHSLILSTEGLFNHWWDFSPAGRDALASLADAFRVKVWVWFREPVGFVRSSYIQMLKNPQGFVPIYGRDLSVDEMLDDPWFSRHLDYIGFIRDVESVLGRGAVVPFAYQGDTIDAFLGALGVEDIERPTLRENRSVGELGVKLLGVFNRLEVGVKKREAGVALIRQIDALFGSASQSLRLAPATEARILRLAFPSLCALEREYGLSLWPLGSPGKASFMAEGTSM